MSLLRAGTTLVALVAGVTRPSVAEIESLEVELLGSYSVTDYDPWVADVWGFTQDDREFALLCCGNSLRVLDCTDPANIVLASLVERPVEQNDLKDVKVWGNYAYACLEIGDVLIVDISDPYDAHQVGAIPQWEICWPTPCEIPSNGGCHNLWIDDRGYLFLAGVHFDTTLIFDLNADPEAPPLVGRYDPGYIHDLYVWNGRGYVANPDAAANEWEIVDFSNVQAPVRVSGMTYDSVHYAHASWPTEDGNYLLTSDEGEGGHLGVFDIRDPEAPVLVAEYEVGSGSSIHNIMVRGRYAFIAYYDRGLRVLDLIDPTNPVEVGYYDDDRWDDVSCSFGVYRGIWGVYANNPSGNVFVSEMCGGGLHVLDFALDDVAPAPVGDRVRLEVWPNPSSALVEFRAELDAPGPVTAEVFDASGRKVRTLADREERPQGLSIWAWDGRDDDGTPAPVGVYFARVEQGKRAALQKVAWIR
ncbi:MAG: choice-of-anchor B family protein [Candidatus Eisenbacteria bacterium]|uniref:Choice-of-anchor B family protein n=1 Tax=Eiseniibacteriota bacterium TaxID=2212470 RepID=A0A956NAT6_UNCEI|nr:choice-of-anchor B family protein [Candidatus Eisenbacteria bacterium]MCB9463288.1 choice-of-anchor B family protein [Candidatus Eisenbacteria bacterium]